MEKTDISPKELEQVEKSFALYIERQTKKQTPEDIESQYHLEVMDMLEIFEELDEFLNNRTANFFNEFAEMYRLATKNTDKDSFSKVSRIYSALNTLAAVLTSHRHLIRAKIKEYEALNENVEKYFFGTTAD